MTLTIVERHSGSRVTRLTPFVVVLWAIAVGIGDYVSGIVLGFLHQDAIYTDTHTTEGLIGPLFVRLALILCVLVAVAKKRSSAQMRRSFQYAVMVELVCVRYSCISGSQAR